VTRPTDRVSIKAGGKVFDQIEKVEITWDLSAPAQAVIQFGDEGAWAQLGSAFQPGTPWTVAVNDMPMISGRAELLELDGDDHGIVCAIAIRTRLSDALVASADTSIVVAGVSVAEFMVAALSTIGYTSSDFVVDHRTAAVLLSGAPSKTSPQKTDLEPIQVPQAKIQPGESIMEAVTRHADRHGLIVCDLPNGRIGVFRPDPDASPYYYLRLKRGSAADRRANNIVKIHRSCDWTQVPSEVVVYGQTWGGELAKAPIHSSAGNPEVLARAAETGHFNRRVVTVQNQIQNNDQARRKASKLLSSLVSRQDAWDIVTDGLTYWDGSKQTRWAITAIASIECDVMGAPAGNYFVNRVRMKQDDQGSTTTLSVVRADLLFNRETGLLGKQGTEVYNGPFKTPEFNFDER